MRGQDVAQGKRGIGLRIGYRTLYALFNLAKSHCGAVVVQKIITVGTVLGLDVVAEQAVKYVEFRL